MATIFERLSELHATSLSDALNGCNVMASYIRPLREDSLLIGPAYTVRPIPGDHTSVVKGLASAAKGEVLVIDGAGLNEAAYLGEMMSTFGMQRGLAGVVIDGGIRDSAGVRNLNKFTVFARGVTARSAVEGNLGEVQVPISCGNVTVHPGDWVFGDDDGVVIIPSDRIEEIIKGAQESEAVDVALREGADFMSFLGMDKLLQEKEKERAVKLQRPV